MPAVFDCVLTVCIGGDDAARRREMRLNVRIASLERAALTAIDLVVRDGHAVHRVQFGKNRLIGGAAAVIDNHNMLETLVQQAADVCGQAVIRLKGRNKHHSVLGTQRRLCHGKNQHPFGVSMRVMGQNTPCTRKSTSLLYTISRQETMISGRGSCKIHHLVS